jgi:hypothetical protein
MRAGGNGNQVQSYWGAIDGSPSFTYIFRTPEINQAKNNNNNTLTRKILIVTVGGTAGLDRIVTVGGWSTRTALFLDVPGGT